MLGVFRRCARAGVSGDAEGPRGGGRDRDHIVRHIFANEQDWAKKLGVLTPDEAMLTDEGLNAQREDYCNAIRDVPFPGQNGPQLAAAVPDPAHRLSHARSRLGNGRQGFDCKTSVRPSATARRASLNPNRWAGEKVGLCEDD